jgi:hypothetical protein
VVAVEEERSAMAGVAMTQKLSAIFVPPAELQAVLVDPV